MNKEFLKNFQIGGQALPDVVADAILAEHNRLLDAAKADPGANGGTGGKTFTQEDVNRIVSERLASERKKQAQQPPQEDERARALKARETRLDCRDYLDRKQYSAALLDILDCSDVERFKTAVDALAERFPQAFHDRPTPPPYAVGTGSGSYSFNPIAAAFRPDSK